MRPAVRRLAIGYGVFCVVNYGISYMAARSGVIVGTGNGLVDFNAKLSRLNPLQYIFGIPGIPVTTASSSVPSPPPYLQMPISPPTWSETSYGF